MLSANSVIPIAGNSNASVITFLSLPANLWWVKRWLCKEREGVYCLCLSHSNFLLGTDIAKTTCQINLSNSTSFSKDWYSSPTILSRCGAMAVNMIRGLNYGIYNGNRQQQNNDTSRLVQGRFRSWRTPRICNTGIGEAISHSKSTVCKVGGWKYSGSGLIVWPDWW